MMQEASRIGGQKCAMLPIFLAFPRFTSNVVLLIVQMWR